MWWGLIREHVVLPRLLLPSTGVRMAYCPGDNSNWLSSFEEECVSDFESDGDCEQQLLVDKELAARRLWLTFQESANAVSHFYRGR